MARVAKAEMDRGELGRVSAETGTRSVPSPGPPETMQERWEDTGRVSRRGLRGGMDIGVGLRGGLRRGRIGTRRSLQASDEPRLAFLMISSVRALAPCCETWRGM